MACHRDGAGFSTCVSPYSLTSLTFGLHTFSVRTIDAAGSNGPAATFTWAVAPTGGGDTTPGPTLISSTPTDGSSATSYSSTYLLPSDRSVVWSGVTITHDSDAAIALPGGTGQTLAIIYPVTANGLYTINATINDGLHTPVVVTTHFTIWNPPAPDPAATGTIEAPPTAVTAAPAVVGTLESSDGASTVTWPAEIVPTTGMVVSIDPLPVAASTGTFQIVQAPVGQAETGFSVGTNVINVTVRQNGNNTGGDTTMVHTFIAPIVIHMDTLDPADVPATSQDGITWRPIPEIYSPTLYPGTTDGFLRTATGVDIYTLHLTQFALLKDTKPPTAPDKITATLNGTDVTVRWSPAEDNSGSMAYYTLWIDGKDAKVLGGYVYEYTLGPVSKPDTHLYRVQATDGAGNSGPGSAAITGVPDLTGMTVAQAKDAVEARGFTVGTITNADKGTKVATQSPAFPGYGVVGSNIDFTLAVPEVRQPLALKVTGSHRIDTNIRHYVAARVSVNQAATVTATLMDAKKKTVAKWMRSVKAGVWILQYQLPSGLASGSYKLTVAATTANDRKAYTVPVQIKSGTFPVVGRAKVIVVGDAKGHSSLALKVEPNMEVVVTSDSRVFDVAGSSRNVAVIVVDVDAQGVKMIHNLHIVFPSVRIVAVTSHASDAVAAKRYGATYVVIGTSTPGATGAFVSAAVQTIVANKS